ncbi:MAG: peroxiredoxin family protein [Opitutaceae bacterium]|nr:peroxiredoxin family protein [Opitutaceae bacterium]
MRSLSHHLAVLFTLVVGSSRIVAADAVAPKVGQPARNFTLSTLDDRTVELRSLTAKGPVVLVVLRGWPGYQCPVCTRQVNDFVSRADNFVARGAQVIMVYPGPAGDLKAHASEFLENKQWPRDFIFVLDPAYSLTESYGLRWNAKNETAYPSTFVIDRGGIIRFALVSTTHGGRASAQAALDALPPRE